MRLLCESVQMFRKTPRDDVIWCFVFFCLAAHLTHAVWSMRRIKTRSLVDFWISCQSKKNWLCQRRPGWHQQLLLTVQRQNPVLPWAAIGCTIVRSQFPCHAWLPSWIFSDLFIFTFDSLGHYLQVTTSLLRLSLTVYQGVG